MKGKIKNYIIDEKIFLCRYRYFYQMHVQSQTCLYHHPLICIMIMICTRVGGECRQGTEWCGEAVQSHSYRPRSRHRPAEASIPYTRQCSGRPDTEQRGHWSQ